MNKEDTVKLLLIAGIIYIGYKVWKQYQGNLSGATNVNTVIDDTTDTGE